MSVTIVVPTRKRPNKYRKMNELFPDALWCMSEEDAPTYAVPKSRKLIHPDSLIGLAAKRQWILDNVKGAVFMPDDDITGTWCNVGSLGRWINGAAKIRQIIENTNECAEGFGAPVWGFNQAWDVRKYHPVDPIGLTGWVGTAIGFTSDRSLKYDTDLLSQADIDFCLRSLLKKRLIYVDKRFAFVCQRFNNAGGSAGVRSFNDYQEQVKRVVSRWGNWITYKRVKTTFKLGVSVPRRQKLDFGED